MHIEIDDLSRPQVHSLLEEHLANMHELSPPEQVFALDLSKLRVPEITFWTVWDQENLLGCGAVKELSPTHGEIKSMRTPAAARGRGAGRALLTHIITVAKQRGYTKLSLETGSHPAFEPAHSLYRSAGFQVSGPFGSYPDNPHSVFMELALASSKASAVTPDLSIAPPVTRRFLAGWADMDWNSHMANTAYLNKVVDARVLALADMGFPMEEFVRLRLGVVIMKDELEYKREIKWMEEFDITFSIAGLAADGSRFKVQNEVRLMNGDLAARITSTGGFLDLDARKLVAPSSAILAAYQSLPRTKDFVELPSSVKVRS